jgi:hypothetical protein
MKNFGETNVYIQKQIEIDNDNENRLSQVMNSSNIYRHTSFSESGYLLEK